jgi:ATP-dependent RNA helicase DDX41
VEASAIHGGMDQEERERSIDTFKAGQRDVLVATDVASKVGAHFRTVHNWIAQGYEMLHVINNGIRTEVRSRD